MMRFILLILCFLFFFQVERCEFCILPSSESDGLESLRAEWDVLASSGWVGNASTQGCQWTGVSCLDNQTDCHVVGLELSQLQLNATLPDILEPTTFPFLQLLNLSRTNLYGVLPSIWQYFSPSRLDISHNHLEGLVPFNASSFASISLLDISFNHLSGSLPPDVCQVPHFQAKSNNFSCPLPPCCSEKLCDVCLTPATHSVWRMWVASVIFLAVIALVLFPVKISIRQFKFDLDFAFAPWLGIIAMLMLTVTNFQVVWTGFLGSPQTLQPWTIVLFFFSLAYLAVSLDQTGALEAVARWTAMKFSASGTHLFVAMFSLAGTITILSSNDIVILTLTPIICYVCSYSKIDPIPFLYAEFFASNLFSIILIIGNPTNVIACEGTRLCTFFPYLLRMILPALVGGFSALLCSYYYFRRSLPATLAKIDLKPLDAIDSKLDASLSSMLTLLCLLTMSLSSFFPSSIRLWMVGVLFGILALLKDALLDLGDRFFPSLMARFTHPTSHPYYERSDHLLHSDNEEPVPPSQLLDGHDDHEHISIEMKNLGESSHPDSPNIEAVQPDQPSNPSQTNEMVAFSSDDSTTVESTMETGHHRDEIRVIAIGKKLPHKVLPFITGMFILVEVLNQVGLIDIFASLIAPLCTNIWSTVFVVGLSSTLMCNLINNQPMTIFFTRVLLSSSFQVGANIQGALYSLIVGSNLGADFTLIGALAGLMWREILHNHHVEVTYGQFVKIGIIVMTLPLLLIFVTLSLVLMLF